MNISDTISEIFLSYGSLPNKQTKSGFFAGKSKPRCNELAEIFLQLRISERSGRGVTKIVDTYGMESIKIADDYIRVTFPFAYERYFGVSVVEQKTEQKKMKQTDRVKSIILTEMRHNASITTNQLMELTGLKKTSIQNYLRELTAKGIIRRVGSKKGGYWEVFK